MVKEVDDEQVKDDIIPGEQDNEQEQPKDVRGAIRAAMEEVNDDTGENKRDNEQDLDKPKRQSKSRDSNKLESDESSEKDGNKRQEKKDKEETSDAKSVSSKESEKKEEVKIDPPPFYKNKGKAVWDKLSPEDRQFLVAREKEVSDGFAQVSQRIKSVENLEKAIAPRLPAIQQFGVEPAVVVDRLFQWMEGLNNPQTQLNTFKELAKSFGVNLNRLVSKSSNVDPNVSDAEVIDQPDPSEPPEWFTQTINPLQQEIGELKNKLTTQEQSQLASYITNWSKDKPYYAKVGPLMAQLIAGGVVPPKNGMFDLDAAYEKAILLDPEIQTQIKQAADEKAAEEAKAKLEKEAKERADKLVKAKKAGAGIKPSPRSMPAAPVNQKKANGSGKVSVRDSISAALEELRE